MVSGRPKRIALSLFSRRVISVPRRRKLYLLRLTIWDLTRFPHVTLSENALAVYVNSAAAAITGSHLPGACHLRFGARRPGLWTPRPLR